MPTLSIHVSDEIAERVESEVLKRKRSKSSYLSQIIEAHFRRAEAREIEPLDPLVVKKLADALLGWADANYLMEIIGSQDQRRWLTQLFRRELRYEGERIIAEDQGPGKN